MKYLDNFIPVTSLIRRLCHSGVSRNPVAQGQGPVKDYILGYRIKPGLTRLLTVLLTFFCCTGMAHKSIEQDINFQKPAVIVLADQRFNPTVQRLLAKQDLKALPIGNAGVIFVIPMYQDPLLEEMQIQYLEKLIKNLESSEPASN